MGKEYFAFISYKEDDYKYAKWLQKKLENYRFPTSIRKENPNLPDRIRPVFEYKSEMAGGELKPEIDKALAGSQYLIVICSPNATKSPWVADEVQRFIDTGRTDKIIPFVVAGEAYSKDPAKECFPEPLRNLTEPKRGISINEMGRDAAVIKVVAEMLGVKFDSLWRRYEREQRRKRWLWSAFFFSLAIIASGVAYWMSLKNTELKLAYDKLGTAYVQIQQDSIVQARHIARIKGDSIRIASQNDSINNVNNDLDYTINQLKQREHELLIANNDLRVSQIISHCENANRLITEDNSVDAKEELGKAIKLYSGLQIQDNIPELEYSLRSYASLDNHKVQELYTISGSIESYWGDSTFAYQIEGNICKFNKNNGKIEDCTVLLPWDKYPTPINFISCKHDQVLIQSDSHVLLYDLLTDKIAIIEKLEKDGKYECDIDSRNVVVIHNNDNKEFAEYHVSSELVASKKSIVLNYPDGCKIQKIYGDSLLITKSDRNDSVQTDSYLVWDRKDNRLLSRLDVIARFPNRTKVFINPITHEYVVNPDFNDKMNNKKNDLIFLPMMNKPLWDYSEDDEYERMKGFEDCGYYHSVLDIRNATYQTEHVVNDTLKYFCKYKIDDIYETGNRYLHLRTCRDKTGQNIITIDNRDRGGILKSLPEEIISLSFSEHYNHICVEYGSILHSSYKILNAITLEEVYSSNIIGKKFQWRNDSVFTFTDKKHRMSCYTIKKGNDNSTIQYDGISADGMLGVEEIRDWDSDIRNFTVRYAIEDIKTRENLNTITTDAYNIEREKLVGLSPNGQFAMLAGQKEGRGIIILYQISKNGTILEPYKTFHMDRDIKDYEIRFCDDSKHFAVKEKCGIKKTRFILYYIYSTKPVYEFDLRNKIYSWWMTPQNEFVYEMNDSYGESYILRSPDKESALPFGGVHGISRVTALCFNKNSSNVLRGTHEGYVDLWNGIDRVNLSNINFTGFEGVTGSVDYVDIDEKEKNVLALVYTTDSKHIVFVWDIKTQKKIAEIQLKGIAEKARFTTGNQHNIIIDTYSESYLLPFDRLEDLLKQFSIKHYD